MTESPPTRRGRPPAGGREAILASTLELLRERGIGRVTTREVATRAGVSEASIFYHYADRAGLLMAVFEEGLRPLQALGQRGQLDDPDRVAVMTQLARAIDRFLDQALPVINASQSDAKLRDTLAAYMREQDLGPHRGVRTLGGYLAAEQAAGRVRPDIDPQAVALMLVGSCFMRASQGQMPAHKPELPEIDEVIGSLDTMLHPGETGPQR